MHPCFGQEHSSGRKQQFFGGGGRSYPFSFKNLVSSDAFLLSVSKTHAYILGFHQQTSLPFLISHTQLQVFIPFTLKAQFGPSHFNIIHQNGESITFGGSAPKVLRESDLSFKQLHYMKHIVDHRYCTTYTLPKTNIAPKNGGFQ